MNHLISIYKDHYQLFLYYLIFTCLPVVLQAGDNQEEFELSIQQASDQIQLDGLLLEESWQNADKATDFWMSFPIDDELAELKTEVSLTYDDQFLYVGAICYGKGDYIIQTLKRDVDFWEGEGFAILIDPINSRTNGFVFGVNPEGVQMEMTVAGSTGRRGGRPRGMNTNWDQKWYAESHVGQGYWSVEMAIPFKSIRYDKEKDAWGINFIRSEMNSNSYHTWAKVPRQFRSIDLGYTGRLLWNQSPKETKSNIVLIPFATASSARDFEDESSSTEQADIGLDAKIAVTSTLNLDVTINPDFSQVEVDQQVTNLTRFSIRFPERRLFFLENSDLFESFGSGPARPFFSRRIGLDSDNNPVPIYMGMRLSGNLNETMRIGVMNMLTDSEIDGINENYTAIAAQQNIFGRTVVRGIFLNKQQLDGAEFVKDSYGRNAGLEFDYFSDDNTWNVWGGYNKSFKNDVSGKDQYFKTGVSYNTQNVSVFLSYHGLQDNYSADMGFLQRTRHYDAIRDTSFHLGYHSLFSDLGYTIYPDNPKINSHNFSAVLWNVLGDDGSFRERRTSAEYQLSWANRSRYGIELTNREVNLLFPFGFTDGEPLAAGRYSYSSIEMQYQSDQRRKVAYEVGGSYGEFYSGMRLEMMTGLNFRAQPWGNFEMNFAYNNLQFPDPIGDEQLFLISPRIEINFNRNLFWTTFLQFNTQSENFNVNSRLQWRFKPMSDLFLVYTDNYATDIIHPTSRSIVFKMNYWLNI